MQKGLAVVLLLIAETADGRRESIQVHEAAASEWSLATVKAQGAEEALEAMYTTFGARVKDGTPATSIVNNVARIAKSTELGDGRLMNHAGWVVLLSRVGLTPEGDLAEQAMKEAWIYLSDAPYGDSNVENRKMDPFVAGQRIEYTHLAEARKKVLQSIYKKVAGNLQTVLEEAMLTCKINKASMITSMGGAPVTFAKFSEYYAGLGMFIASDDQFVLMLVNAWHHMEDGYDAVNTVNKRVMCTTSDGAQRVVTIKDDCQGHNWLEIAKAQEGVDFESCVS